MSWMELTKLITFSPKKKKNAFGLYLKNSVYGGIVCYLLFFHTFILYPPHINIISDKHELSKVKVFLKGNSIT